MSQEHIALFMFASMMLMLFTGQRVFGAIGAIAAIAAIALWGTGGQDIPFAAAMKLMKWYPLLTLPMFIFMGYVLSESRLADDLYRMFHVWFGNDQRRACGMGTIGLNGTDLCHEWPVGCRYGHRCNHRLTRATAQGL